MEVQSTQFQQSDGLQQSAHLQSSGGLVEVLVAPVGAEGGAPVSVAIIFRMGSVEVAS